MTDSLRIALLLDPLVVHARGGDHAWELRRELVRLGHTIECFGAQPAEAPRGARMGEAAEDGKNGAARAVVHGAGIAAFRPDAIVAYGALSPAAAWGARTARRLGIPLVLVETGFPSVRRWHERALRWLGERVWSARVRRTAATVIALDPLAREQLLKAGFGASQVEVMPAGVDLSVYRPDLPSSVHARLRIRGRTLLYVGPLEERRGLEVLINAFARTVGRREDWNLAIAGDGPARSQLRALVERLGIGARVLWLGRPQPEDLPSLMAACTFLAVPALGDEVRGVQVARALASGLPVLASDLPRVAALVEHDVCGLLAPAGDLERWTDMIRWAAGSPTARRRWRDNARRIAEERLSWPKVASAFERVLLREVRAAEDAGIAAELGEADAVQAP